MLQIVWSGILSISTLIIGLIANGMRDSHKETKKEIKALERENAKQETKIELLKQQNDQIATSITEIKTEMSGINDNVLNLNKKIDNWLSKI